MEAELMSPEEIQIIKTFKESNPTMGVKKIVDNLRNQIPSINGKMVRSVEVPRPEAVEAEQDAASATATIPKKKSKKSRSKPQKKPSVDYTANLSFGGEDNDVLACSENLQQMYLRREMEGKEVKGYYPLLADRDTKYKDVLWVDLSQGNQNIMFEMLQMQIMFGSKEAVSHLWKLLKKARSDTPGGEARVSDLAIAQQLEGEFGTNPMAVGQPGPESESGEMDLKEVTSLFKTIPRP
ncbi:hypothetical protein MSAN_00232200 [Mycena sanguinolenta]|uniref:Uncharacterized protein n=1 Tax=Mycena sanguinolenta TaxID=230812 RepID=A0A8H6ZMA3_9AGAR|nr:hypothetical protein MSAN_00232200 [Mycena sanguinolenta]